MITYKEIEGLSREELIARLATTEHSYYQLRDEVMTAKEKNHAALRYMRRDIARIKTRLQNV